MKFKGLVVAAFVTLLLAGRAYAQNTYGIAEFVSGDFGGGSYRSTFILVNNTDTDTTAVLQLTDDNGAPVTVTIPGFGTNSQFSIPLAAGATRMLQTDGLGTVVSGAGVVTCPIAIGVSAIVTIYDTHGNYLTEAGVGTSAPVTEFVLPVDTTGLFNTGLALYDGGAVAANLTLILRGTNGLEVSRISIALASHHHIARFVAGAGQFFPTATSFQGTLLVQSSVPVVALVMRMNGSPLSFTSLPVVPTSSTKTALLLPLVWDGFYSAGIYKTAFLIFNISSTTANVTLNLTIPVTIPGQGTGTSFSFPPLAPGASIFLHTDGSGASGTGSATITSNVPVGAGGIFTLSDQLGAFKTEAGVGDSPVLTAMTLPVDLTGQGDTGVGFFNPSGAATQLSFRILDADGLLTVPDTSVPLAAMGNIAEYVSMLFPGIGGFRGSLVVTASPGVAAVTLRENRLPLAYTTLPVFSGKASGKTGTAGPLLTVTQTGINGPANNPDTTLNVVLPAGFKLSGTVSGAGQGQLVMANGGGNNLFFSPVDSTTGKYLMVVPAGTYSLTATYQPSGTPSGATLNVSYTDPIAVPVSADTTRDISLPAVTLFNVSGTVSGVATLPAGGTTTIVFTANDNTSQGQFTLNANGSYQGVLPSGNYVVCISDAPIQFSLFQSESLNLYNVGSLVVAAGPATGNFAAPSLAQLSGTISGGGVTSLLGTSVTAQDTSAPVSAVGFFAAPASSSATTDFLGHYQMILAQNRSFSVNVSVLLMSGSTPLGTILYPVPSTVVNLPANTVQDFNLPNLPNTATIHGRVTDSIGGVANVAVNAYSQSITGAANTSFSASTITDANGNYSITVLSGTNYQVIFVPPVPVR
ncbi:MAG: carboxypeptidase-like regulatory domain-containing protein [Acidobacteriota bacterium]|jgi:hypothetical protein